MLRKFALAGTLAALLMSIAAIGVTAAGPDDVVRKADTADSRVSYRGSKWTNLFVSGRSVRATYKIVHLKPNSTRIEYLGPPELDGIITISKGSTNWRYLPKKGVWERQRWELDAGRPDLTTKNYKVTDGGTGSVAGRSAYIVKLAPKKHGSPSQTIWVDKQYFLVLKSETRNADGEIKAASAFTDIDFNPGSIKPSLFEVSNRGEGTSSSGKLDFKVVKPGYVPKGYQLVDIGSIKIGDDLAAHLKYTNGLNTISIFQRKGGSSPKALQNLSKVLPRGVRLQTFTRGGITFTIIGDIDKSEIDKIARSLKP